MIDRKNNDISLANARILVVEDEYYLADDLVRTLQREGAAVAGPVGSVAEAQALLGAGAIDCAVLDINLRGEMAFSIADRLEAEGIPFIVASGYTEAAIPERFSGVPHVEKPFDPKDVVALLPALLRQRR